MARRIRTHAEWNVDTHIVRTTGPTSTPTRSRISAAALLVNVIARIFEGGTPWWIRWAMRWVSTRVLPEPAPATTSSGPFSCTTASSWSGFRPSRERRRAAPATTERAGILVVELLLAGRVRVRSIGGMGDVGEEFVVGHGDVHSTEGCDRERVCPRVRVGTRSARNLSAKLHGMAPVDDLVCVLQPDDHDERRRMNHMTVSVPLLSGRVQSLTHA